MSSFAVLGASLEIASDLWSSSTLTPLDSTHRTATVLVSEQPFPCTASYSRFSMQMGQQPWDSVAVDSNFAQKYAELDSSQLNLVGASSTEELLRWREEVIEATKGAIIPCDPTVLEAAFQGSAVADQTFALANLFYYHKMLSFQPTAIGSEEIAAERNIFGIEALTESQELIDLLLAATAKKFNIENSDQHSTGPG